VLEYQAEFQAYPVFSSSRFALSHGRRISRSLLSVAKIMSSDSDSSDSTPAITSLWGADAYFPDAEEAQNEYFPPRERPRQRGESRSIGALKTDEP
jgi:hypothetical protein